MIASHNSFTQKPESQIQMLYILLSILSSTTVLIIFKLLNRFGAPARQTIMVSYAVSTLVGVIAFSPSLNSFITPYFRPWFLVAAIEGIFFYVVFRWMAITTEVNGISVASIASKMSVVIPLTMGIVILDERVNVPIAAGILCGLIAVFLSSTSGDKLKRVSLKWPLLVFISNGLIDATFKLFQVWGLTETVFPNFLITIFAFAFLTGLVHHFTYTERSVSGSSLIAGTFLGIANLGSVHFLLLALATPTLASLFIYSTTNFGIVLAAALVAVALFREKLNLQGWLGLLLAVVSIGLLYIGNV